MSFKDFKKNQQEIKTALDKQKNEEAKSASYVDERFWQPKADSAGNINALIRFLPQQETNKAPYVKTLTHSFQHKGKWFIEDCPWTAKESCPVCMFIKEQNYWKENIELAKKYSSNTWYIANVLVIEDETNPENNGKVKLYKFGNLINKLIDGAMNPSQEALEDNPFLKQWYEETGGNIFDFDRGLNLRLKVSKKTINDAKTNEKKSVNNYEETKFRLTPTAIGDGNETIQESVFNSIVNLQEFIDKKRFKSSEELEKRFFAVINAQESTGSATPAATPAPQNEPTQSAQPAKPAAPAAQVDSSPTNPEDIDYDALLNDDDLPF